MVIDTYVLLAYATIWTIFYWFLSHAISSMSRDKWIEYVRSEESDEMLVEALEAVIEEIEVRMHDKLQAFEDFNSIKFIFFIIFFFVTLLVFTAGIIHIFLGSATSGLSL